MEVTLRVTAGNRGRRLGRIIVRADDPSLTAYAGLAVSGELARRVRLAELIDAELALERRARPVKVRRRGLSPGRACRLVGGVSAGRRIVLRPHRGCPRRPRGRALAGGRRDAVGA